MRLLISESITRASSGLPTLESNLARICWSVIPELPSIFISEVKIEGNSGITDQQIRAKLLSKVGSPLDARVIDSDIKSLMGQKWFSDVTPWYNPDPKDPSGKSFILIFTVKEMPILRVVEFRGLTKIRRKEVEENTGLK